MLDETRHRRADFLPGCTVCLADGQLWTLPTAPRTAGSSHELGPDYDALIDALDQAEDEAERARGELVLVIFLLTRNYNLTPMDYQSLLMAPSGSSALARLQSQFRKIAEMHARRGTLTGIGPCEASAVQADKDAPGSRPAYPRGLGFPTPSLGKNPG
jgi:hypothetical protein